MHEWVSKIFDTRKPEGSNILDTDQQKILAIGQRLGVLAAALGTKRAAAAIAEISPQQLHNMITAKSAPSLLPVAKMAAAAGFRLDWVMWGDGQPEIQLRPWVEAMGAPPGLSGDELLDLRRLIFKELARVYAGTPWALDPMSDADDMLVRDIIEQIDALPDEMRQEAVRLVSSAHRAALFRMGQAPKAPVGMLHDSARLVKKKGR